MQVKVIGRHMNVTDPTREYAEEKFGRLSKIYDAEPIVAEVVLDVRKNRSRPDRFTAEVTIYLKGHVVRAEETSTDMHAAIDLAADKAESQMRKYKTKVIDRRNHGVSVTKTAPGDMQISDEPEEPEQEVVRVKTVDAKPMTEEEAMLQLELLGHDFFVFRHAETEAVNVLYRRNDGDYGLIQPRL
jgi:putative sigma-54 modulation protein